jgi:uncharacterized protein YcaQ
MHPRRGFAPWPPHRRKQAKAIVDFVRDRGIVHPSDVDEHFAHGTTRNYWGGRSNATTYLLEALHYRGLLRVVGRSAGIRLYSVPARLAVPGPRLSPDARLDALIDVLARIYCPLPGPSLSSLVSRLRICVPQWHARLPDARQRARKRLARCRIDGIDWHWPSDEQPDAAESETRARLLAPFDPVVWDRRRFELFWGWPYRFEAYTPEAKRNLGYYALPLLWRDRIIGWGNLSLTAGKLQAEFGYIDAQPRERAFRIALDDELDRMRVFLRM